MLARTDRHNNPTAFTTDIAKQADLKLGKDYAFGEAFRVNERQLYTAKLLHSPLDLTIQVIDKIGFRTKAGSKRWSYIDFPNEDWAKLGRAGKVEIIHLMYKFEGGKELEHLFQRHNAIGISIEDALPIDESD